MITKKQSKRVFSGILGFLLAAALFSGCGKKGQKEYEEGMNFYTVQQYDSAVKQFVTAANLGHAEAQCMLGRCFIEEKGVRRDDAEAVKWFRKAAEQGNAASMFYLSICYANGIGVKQNKNEADKLCVKAVENGYDEGYYKLGMMYFNGSNGFQIDLPEAVKWLSKAVEQGYQEALEAEIDLSLEWIKETLKKAEDGESYAMGYIASEYQKHSKSLFPINARESEKWLEKQKRKRSWNLENARKPAEEGDVEALWTMIQSDATNREEWFRKASPIWENEALKHNNANAMYYLGCSYRSGYGGIATFSDEKAQEWFRKAAKNGHPDAMMSVAIYNFFGDKKNIDEAIKWFRGAAEKGHSGGMLYLGDCYLSGNGVEKNPAEAAKWYRKAAEKGHEGGMICLGDCYLSGNGVEKNPAEAVKWYRKAAAKGDQTAKERLSALGNNKNAEAGR